MSKKSNMVFIIYFISLIILPDLEVIEAVVAGEGDQEYAVSLYELHTGEKWGWHSGKLGVGTAESELETQGTNSYKIANIYDLDLKTAWVEGEDDYGVGSRISFIMSHANPTNVKEFNGIIEVFNGYCKTEKSWSENSRVNKLKVLVNGESICIIQLADTWQYQQIDLSHLISGDPSINSLKKLKEGDELVFEIISIYPGSKHKDAAIAELVTPSYGGG